MVEDSPAGEGASTTTPLFTKIGFDGEVGLIIQRIWEMVRTSLSSSYILLGEDERQENSWQAARPDRLEEMESWRLVWKHWKGQDSHPGEQEASSF